MDKRGYMYVYVCLYILGVEQRYGEKGRQWMPRMTKRNMIEV